MYEHRPKGLKALRRKFSQKAIYLFTQGDYEYYEVGNRFYKLDKLSEEITPADMR